MSALPAADAYEEFLRAKACIAQEDGFEVSDAEIHPVLLPHQRAIVQWAIRGGRRAIFAAFDLGKSIIQLEILRLVLLKLGGGRGLIIAPLGVRQEFSRDAAMLGLSVRFIRSLDEAEEDPSPSGIYLTNYESVRDGKLDADGFDVVSLDEASCLRGFGGTKTFRTFMAKLAGDDRTAGVRSAGIRYRFVATATPSPNNFIELLAYAAFLGVMDIGQAKTRFFRRNSEKADTLTLHPHKEAEFWLWVSTWAVFVQRPSDLGFPDTGYSLPPLRVFYHEVPSRHEDARRERDGQVRLFRDAAVSLPDAASEKRQSLGARVAKMREILDADPKAHCLLWHHLEAERAAIQRAVPDAVSVWGTQDIEEREERIIGFSEGRYQYLSTKPVIAGSGCNFQRHCHKAIFTGIDYKFNDFIQAIHRLQRFLQTHPVEIHVIHTDAERDVLRALLAKWEKHKELTEKMGEIIREYGLAKNAMQDALKRSIGVERVEATGRDYAIVNNDCVQETRRMADNSVHLVLSSIPFSTQYEYTPSFNDFGHTDTNQHFWKQMGFLTPELLRVLQPGRVAAIHVKDRIVPGGLTGLGFQTVYPFSDDCVRHFQEHGFAYLGRKTIVTDVVRENQQTYRLGWSEQCKDGSRMGVGMSEYLLLFRKPPSDASDGYADEPVVKSKEEYSRSRWQIDAHGFARSSGDRLLTPEDLDNLTHEQIFRLFRDYSRREIYDYEHHVRIGEALEVKGALPVTFMLLQPQSWHPDTWTDITRMRTLNGAQSAAGREMHLCLARGSRVLTKERGYVPIEQVSVGDHVLTHKGRWRPVTIVRRTGIQPVVTLRAQGVPGLTLTPDHKLWVRKSDWVRQRAGAERVEPGWVEAKDTLSAYVNQKLPATEVPENRPETIKEEETLWWTVGRWLADGHIDARGSAVISCGPDKWDHFLTKIGDFGGNTPHLGTAYQLQLRDPGRKLRTILERCGEGAGGKHVPPEAFTLPCRLAAALLDGYLAGDGHFVESRQTWQVSSVSRDLLLGLSFLVHRVHGAIASIFAGRPEREHVIEGRTVQAKQEWYLTFDLSIGRKKPFVLEDGAWKKVREIDDAGEVETWCLRVEEDESFTAEGCIVKNCPLQFDLADRVITQFSMKGEVVFDPFSGLGTVPYRAVLLRRRGLGVELNPRYFVDACHYLKAAEAETAMPSLFDLIEAEDAAASVPATPITDIVDDLLTATGEEKVGEPRKRKSTRRAVATKEVIHAG